MGLVLLNLQSKQHINLDIDNPLIIGRGNIIGCSDKRVSRNHGKITCSNDGKLHLVALHSNPCYFTKNGVPPILQLNKNEEQTLSEGDCLGLLPNSCWFQITSNKHIHIKNENDVVERTSNSSNEAQGEENNLDLKKVEETMRQTEGELSKICDNLISPQPSTSDLLQSKVQVSINEENSTSTIRTTELEKTQRLPLWMYEIDEPKQVEKSPIKRPLSKELGSLAQADNSQETLAPKIMRRCGSSSEDIEILNLPSCSNTLDMVLSSSTSESGGKSESDNEQLVAKDSSSSTNQLKEGYEADFSEVSAQKRPICQYEGNCFRKNPQHKIEYCHPGDSDFIPFKDRPQCQYGSACYRKNPIHRAEYRHDLNVPSPRCRNLSSSSENLPQTSSNSPASSPLPAKRRRKTINHQNSDYLDEDDFNQEDPFGTDDSSDEFIVSGEGSDLEESD